MKTLVVYCSDHGFCEKCANILKEKAQSDISLVNLKSNKNVAIDDFDTIIMGASIHAGKVQKQLKNFMNSNEKELLSKNIGFYLCCMDESKVEEYYATEMPEALLEHAFAKAYLGHAFYFDRMNFVIRKMIKKIANVDKDQESLRYDNMMPLLEKIQ